MKNDWSAHGLDSMMHFSQRKSISCDSEMAWDTYLCLKRAWMSKNTHSEIISAESRVSTRDKSKEQNLSKRDLQDQLYEFFAGSGPETGRWKCPQYLQIQRNSFSHPNVHNTSKTENRSTIFVVFGSRINPEPQLPPLRKMTKIGWCSKKR